MNLEKTLTIADIVSSNIKSAHVFKKFGIDFCCGGGITIEKACTKYNINIEILLQELKNLDDSQTYLQNYNLWELDFLIDYIINNHHNYVKLALPMIDEYATKVSKVHGAAYPEVVQIEHLFKQVAEELKAHMNKEELVLFPYIKKCVGSKKTHSENPIPPFGTILNPIHMMQQEHEQVGNMLKEIAQLSNYFIPPIGACNTFKALYSKLDEFEQDLHIHVHLENNILFPKATLLETQLDEKL
ncbi:MAG: iron-sulfur cluster repair di-iron protein [Saprospiraceae bacterium]|nr:iron-sulfur cluster repair di-iron protein [Saprospiraceae bacterium]